MGLMDDLLKQSGGLGAIASAVAGNPQLLAAATSLLSSKEGTIGGPGGLAGLVQAFSNHGLGDVVSSWVGGGPNQPVSPTQVTNVLGPDTVNQFAAQAGIDAGQAGSVLANLLPELVNHLTPNGAVPQGNALEGALGGLLSGFLK